MNTAATHHPSASRATNPSSPVITIPSPAAKRHPLALPHIDRPTRVLCIVVLVWLMSVVDLRFTLLEASSAHFIELNPVAAELLTISLDAVALYKVTMLGIGTGILLALRRHALSEFAAWLLLGVFLALMVLWTLYYDILPHGAVPGQYPPLAYGY